MLIARRNNCSRAGELSSRAEAEQSGIKVDQSVILPENVTFSAVLTQNRLKVKVVCRVHASFFPSFHFLLLQVVNG